LRKVILTTEEKVHDVLVDNSDRYDSSGFFRKSKIIIPNAYLIKPNQNLGYFGGADFGLHFFREAVNVPLDWIIVSNVDLEIREMEFFDLLCSSHNLVDVGIIAPSIWDEGSQRDVNPYLMSRIPRRRMTFYRSMFNHYYLANLYILLSVIRASIRRFFSETLVRYKNSIENQGAESTLRNDPTEIYAPHGSFIVFHREYFRRGGTLKHISFLFEEEIFVAETLKRLELKAIYDPSLKLWHKAHVSTGSFHRIFRSREMVTYLHKAIVAIYGAYY
jgi:GT2 family glycosyltransferase